MSDDNEKAQNNVLCISKQKHIFFLEMIENLTKRSGKNTRTKFQKCGAVKHEGVKRLNCFIY